MTIEDLFIACRFFRILVYFITRQMSILENQNPQEKQKNTVKTVFFC